jgi:hypothetical protein
MAKKRRKLSLKKAAEKLAKIAEQHLASLPDEEQAARVAIFSRRKFKSDRGGRTTLSRTCDTQVYPVAARGRE